MQCHSVKSATGEAHFADIYQPWSSYCSGSIINFVIVLTYSYLFHIDEVKIIKFLIWGFSKVANAWKYFKINWKMTLYAFLSDNCSRKAGNL